MTVPTVLIVAPSAYLFGGLATWLDYLDPGLHDRGWRVVVGLVEGPRHHRPAQYLQQHPHQDVIRIHCETGTHYGRIKSLTQTVRQLQPDVLLGVNIPHVVPAVQECRPAVQTKLALTIHGFQVDLFRDLRHFQMSCDAVVSANRLGCLLAVEYAGFDSERVFHAPCGTTVPATLPQSGVPGVNEPLRIAWVGRLENQIKRICDLPPILEGLDRRGVPFHLTVVGSGPDENLCENLLQPWVRRGSATLVGYIEARNLPEGVYSRSDAILITSPCEAGPIVAWEAMAHGVVVVSSRYLGSGAERALRHMETALQFDVADTEDAAEQLAGLYRSPQLREQLRAKGFDTVARNYSQMASIQAWDQSLRAILRDVPIRTQIDRRLHPGLGSRSRLDAWCGSAFGEAIRRWTGRVPPLLDPGSEWPHAIIQSQGDDPDFWQLAKELDQVNSTGRAKNVSCGLDADQQLSHDGQTLSPLTACVSPAPTSDGWR